MTTSNPRNVDNATITRYVLILLGFIVLALILYNIRNLIAVIYISFIVAATLHPIALILQRRMPRIVALLIIYLLLASAVILLGVLIFPPLAIQLGSFLALLPERTGTISELIDSVDYWLSRAGVPINLASLADQARSELVGLAVQLVQVPVLLYEATASAFAIVALSFYWLLDRDQLIDALLSFAPEGRRGRARIIYLRSELLLGAFVRGLAIASIILGIVTYLGLLILGVPFPLLLAIVAAMLEVIPIVGPTVAAIPIVGIALSQSFGLGLITLVFWIGVQVLEGNLMTPIIQRHTVRLPPFVVIVSLLIGGALLGILGALLAIPTAVLIGVIRHELSPSHVHHDDESVL